MLRIIHLDSEEITLVEHELYVSIHMRLGTSMFQGGGHCDSLGVNIFIRLATSKCRYNVSLIYTHIHTRNNVNTSNSIDI
jgi:hypothetical protein